MGRADSLAVIAVSVSVVMATGAGNKACGRRAELRATMFGVTSDTADSGVRVLMYDGGNERFGRVTGSALRFDAGPEGMTRSAGAGVGVISNRRRQNQI